MAYYLPYGSELHNQYEKGDIIEIRILRHDKVIYEEKHTSPIKVEHFKTSDCVNYIHDTVSKLDQFLYQSPRGVPLLRRAGIAYNNDDNVKVRNGKEKEKEKFQGLFATFLSKIPVMINFHEKESINFFSQRFSRIFDGVGSIMSAMILTEDSVLNTLTEKHVESSTSIKDSFIKALNDRISKTSLKPLLRRCICSVGKFTNPCVLKGETPEVEGVTVKKCDSIYSVYHVNRKYLKTIIQFGCTGDNNERRIFVYYHFNDQERRIMNVSLLLDTKLSSTFKKFSLGVTCITLYKAQCRCVVGLLPLVHGFPHIDVQLFSGFRDNLMNLTIDVQKITEEVSVSVGNFIGNWMIENRIYQGSGDRIQYLMQPYFSSLIHDDLFQSGNLDYRRLEVLECPEILRFSDSIYAEIQKCLSGLRFRYMKKLPVVPVEKDGQIVLGCGAVVDPVSVFHHPCFVINLSIGRNNNIVLPAWNKKSDRRYSFTQWHQTGHVVNKRSFCRRCSREFPNLQFALLCGIRCTLVDQVFHNLLLSSKELPEDDLLPNLSATSELIIEFLQGGVAPAIDINYSNLISGVLPSEVPYHRKCRFNNCGRDVVQSINLRGEFSRK